MLHTAIPAAAKPLPWAHLDIPHRIARVLDTARLVGGNDCATREDFLRAPETCDLTVADIEANIGEAQRILIQGRIEPAYDRPQRIAAAVAIVGGMLPMVGDMHTALRHEGFENAELADIWTDVVKQSAARFAQHAGGKAADIPGWGRDMLERNAN